MARRWMVNTSNNTLVGVVDDDDATIIPAGRSLVAQSVIVTSGTPRRDIRVGGTWVITNGIGVYTAPAGIPASQRRTQRQTLMARNILKNWLPAANAAIADSDPVVSKRLRLQIDALTRIITVNGTVDDHYAAILPETEVSGYDFVLYAGDAWYTATGGYYQDESGGTGFPDGTWTFHTINQALAGSPTQGATNGTSHAGLTPNRQLPTTFYWMRELWKLANP